jgi:hypothetical protein
VGGRRKSTFQAAADSSSKAFKIHKQSPHRTLNGAPDDPATYLQSLESQDASSDSPIVDPEQQQRDGQGLHSHNNDDNDVHLNSSNKRQRRESSSSSSSSSSSQLTVTAAVDASSTLNRSGAAETTATAIGPVSAVATAAMKGRKRPNGNSTETPVASSSQV